MLWFVQEHLHLPHLSPHLALIEHSNVEEVRFVHYSLGLLILGHEVDVVALTLILTSFAVHGVVPQLVQIFLHVVGGLNTHSRVHH